MEKEDKKELQPKEIPSVKKVIDCPKCKAKILVEVEIDLDMMSLMPALGGASLPMTSPPTQKEEGAKEKDE